MLITKPLNELQNELPIGIKLPDGKFYKQFSFKDWLWPEEEAVAKLKQQGKSMGDFIIDVLRLMLTELGGTPVTNISKDEFTVTMLNAYIADVFYMYVYLRFESVGPELPMQLRCMRCGKDYKVTGDLAQFDIVTHQPSKVVKAEDGAQNELQEGEDGAPVTEDFNPNEYAFEEVELFKGIEYRGKKYMTAILKPGKWSVMRSIGQGDVNEAAIKKQMLQSAVSGLPGLEDMPSFVFTDEMLRSLHKRDLEKLIAASTRINAGPEMSVETTCKHCRAMNKYPLDWTYDNFFVQS